LHNRALDAGTGKTTGDNLKSSVEKDQAPENNDSPVAEPATNGAPVPKSEISKLWTRRRVLTLFVSLSAGLLTSVGVPFARKRIEERKVAETKLTANPYFVHKTKRSVEYTDAKLAEGFYAHKPYTGAPKRKPKRSEHVVQYVDAKGRIPFAAYIAVDKLVQTSAPEVLPKSKDKHVTYTRASALFELAAGEALKNGKYGDACNLLVKAIQHDLELKTKLKQAPSLRLFDLLAILAFRLQQQNSFKSLLALAEQAKPVIAQQHVHPRPIRKKRKDADSLAPDARRQKRIDEFQKRIQNWTSSGGAWHERVFAEKYTWKLTVAPDTQKNQSVAMAFDIPLVQMQSTQNPGNRI
jgi:hypothetical protein